MKKSIKNVLNMEMKKGNVLELWYDWFCKNSQLFNRGKELISKLKEISGSKKIDIEKTYVFFKNNCPAYGDLYDDFRICSIENECVLYTVIPESGFNTNKGRSVVWGKENNFEKPLIEGTWEDVLSFFNN